MTVARRDDTSGIALYDDAADRARVEALIGAGTTQGSRDKRAQQFADFAEWCRERGLTALPARPGDVALYLGWLSGPHQLERDRVGPDGVPLTPVPPPRLAMRPSSIRKVRSAIKTTHVRASQPDPTAHPAIEEVLRGIDRELHGGRVRRARAAVTDDVAAMVGLDLGGLPGLRNKAVLLLGFGCALRRSELVARDVEHIDRRRDGAWLRIASSKTDQTGKGAVVPIPALALRAVDAWLAAADIRSGPIFRRLTKGGNVWPEPGNRLSAQSVRLIVIALGKLANLTPPDAHEDEERLSGHSLRRGAATSARDHGTDSTDLMRFGRWSTLSSLYLYLEERPWAKDPDAQLGLTALATTSDEQEEDDANDGR